MREEGNIYVASLSHKLLPNPKGVYAAALPSLRGAPALSSFGWLYLHAACITNLTISDAQTLDWVEIGQQTQSLENSWGGYLKSIIYATLPHFFMKHTILEILRIVG